MKDPRTVIDNVRTRIPSGAKLLVAYVDDLGIVRLAQANCDQSDVLNFGNAIAASAMKERVGLHG